MFLLLIIPSTCEALPLVQHLHDSTCFPSPCSTHRVFRSHWKHPAAWGPLHCTATPSVPLLGWGHPVFGSIPSSWSGSVTEEYIAASRVRQKTDLSHPFWPILQMLLLDQWGNGMSESDEVGFSCVLTVQILRRVLHDLRFLDCAEFAVFMLRGTTRPFCYQQTLRMSCELSRNPYF